jgi:hypothetical protein
VQTAEEILPVPRKPRVQSGDQVNVEVDVMLAIKKIVRETIHTFGIPPVYYSIYAGGVRADSHGAKLFETFPIVY